MSGGDDDRPGWVEREKLSFSELDRRRREGKGAGASGPGGARDRKHSEQDTRQALKEADGLFAQGQGGAAGEQLVRAMRQAHGTPGIVDACRAVRAALGVPDDPSDLALFLDCGDPALVIAALEAARARSEAGTLQISSGMRSQARLLAQDPDDAIAEAAEDLLELF
jgi:hypothetical protein